MYVHHGMLVCAKNTKINFRFCKIKLFDIHGIWVIDIYGKCRTMNPSSNTSTTSTGNIQGWSQKK